MGRWWAVELSSGLFSHTPPSAAQTSAPGHYPLSGMRAAHGARRAPGVPGPCGAGRWGGPPRHQRSGFVGQAIGLSLNFWVYSTSVHQEDSSGIFHVRNIHPEKNCVIFLVSNVYQDDFSGGCPLTESLPQAPKNWKRWRRRRRRIGKWHREPKIFLRFRPSRKWKI